MRLITWKSKVLIYLPYSSEFKPVGENVVRTGENATWHRCCPSLPVGLRKYQKIPTFNHYGDEVLKFYQV